MTDLTGKKTLGSKYERSITGTVDDGSRAIVDVYDVLEAFDVTCPALQHAIKKLLCSGLRGHKDMIDDIKEAGFSLERAISLQMRRGKTVSEAPPKPRDLITPQ